MDRVAEQSRYISIYDGTAGIKNYRPKHNFRPAWGKFLELGVDSLCDVGTGWGDLPKLAFEKGARKVIGVDFAMLPEMEEDQEVDGRTLVLKRAFAHDLPLKDKEVEYVTAFDALEHLFPEEVDEVLEEFDRVSTKGMFFSICCSPSGHKVNGKGLHLTVRPMSWWMEKVGRFGPVEREGEILSLSH